MSGALLTPVQTLAAVTVPVWLSVTLACWPRRDADAVQPLCPCGCGYPPNKHNPNRSA